MRYTLVDECDVRPSVASGGSRFRIGHDKIHDIRPSTQVLIQWLYLAAKGCKTYLYIPFIGTPAYVSNFQPILSTFGVCWPQPSDCSTLAVGSQLTAN